MGALGTVRSRGLALVAACALVAGACGSTVAQSERQAALRQGGSTEGGLSGGTAAGTGGSAGGDGLTGTDASGGGGVGTNAGGVSGGTSGGGSATVAGGRGGSKVTTALGPGVTDTTLNVGIIYVTNSGAANAAVGATGIDQGDERTNTQIIIDDINAHGGIAGRKVVPVYHELDGTSNNSVDADYQAACDDLTQDHKVFAMFAGRSDVFVQCMHNRGVVGISDNLTIADASVFRNFPYYYELTAMNLDRIARAEVDALVAEKYFTGWDAANGQPAPGKAKVGVVTLDMPSFNRVVDKTLIPKLAGAGFAPAPADVVRLPNPQRQSEIGALAAAVSNAVLKFRSDGVTHVVIFEATASISLLFGNNAESQHYRPRYAANSQTGQQALADSGAYPKSQLNGAVGIGWLPNLDITPTENPDNGPYSSDARRRCVALYKAKGVTYSNANAEAAALSNCNSLWFLRDVANRSTVLNRDAFLAAVNKLGAGYPSIGNFATRFDADHHDGVAAIRYWAYNSQCGCMRYTSGNITVD